MNLKPFTGGVLQRMPPSDADHGHESKADSGVESALERRPEVLVFDEPPRASIIVVSHPDAGDITPMLLSYTIEVHYRQVNGSSCPPLSRFHPFVSLWGFDGLIGVCSAQKPAESRKSGDDAMMITLKSSPFGWWISWSSYKFCG
jgi:hypothetical protein